MARYRIWLHELQRQPLVAHILKATKKVLLKLSRRWTHRIDANPAGYLASIYKHFHDKLPAQGDSHSPPHDNSLENLANSAPSFEEWMRNPAILKKLLERMDDDTRRICYWKLMGYSDSQIANRLGITPNAVFVRFTRGLEEAKNLLPRDKHGRIENDKQ
jgi:DNA-directed RNA polymerase specialized sigma24 family protein